MSAQPAPLPRPPETDAERRARQLDQLRECAELTMDVVRNAAAKATSPTPPPAGTPDPTLALFRAISAVRQIIALELRVAAGERPPARQARSTPAPLRPDPRRAPLRDEIQQATKNAPNRAALRREMEESLEQELDADPEGDLPLGEILASLCKQHGLPFDPSQLPDHFLIPVRSWPPGRDPDTITLADVKPTPVHPRE